MLKKTITKTITSLTLLVGLLLSACDGERRTQATTVQNSKQNEIELPIYRIEVKICEGVLGSLVNKKTGCYHNQFLVWGSPNTSTINENFNPKVILLANGPIAPAHLAMNEDYHFVIESHSCWPENQPSPKGFYLFVNAPIVLKNKFHNRRKQIQLTSNQVEVQLLTKFDEMLSEQINYNTSINPHSCKKINLPSNS